MLPSRRCETVEFRGYETLDDGIMGAPLTQLEGPTLAGRVDLRAVRPNSRYAQYSPTYGSGFAWDHS